METDELEKVHTEEYEKDTILVWITVILITISTVIVLLGLPYLMAILQMLSMINSFAE